jgi:TRAP-type C4-dicarboxylate transport system permease small subunit
MVQSIAKWLGRCEIALVYTGVLATFLMMCLTSADAFSRYLFNSPIMGAYEITEKYLMVAAVFLGLSYAYRGGGFIRVTFLVDRLPGRFKLAADYAAHAVSAAICLVLLLATAQQAIRSLSDDTTLSALPILIGPAYWFVPLGFLALTVLALRDLARVRTGQSFLLSKDEPTAQS